MPPTRLDQISQLAFVTIPADPMKRAELVISVFSASDVLFGKPVPQPMASRSGLWTGHMLPSYLSMCLAARNALSERFQITVAVV